MYAVGAWGSYQERKPVFTCIKDKNVEKHNQLKT